MDATSRTTATPAAPDWPRAWTLPASNALSVEQWLARRPVRIVLLLSAVWLLNAFDLLFTVLASQLGALIELNPVAARFLDGGSFAALGLYKASLVVIGSCLLWHCRRHRLSEVGCWLLFALYSGLAWRWLHYYQVWNYYCHGGGAAAECDGP